jgi:hypothetical protein
MRRFIFGLLVGYASGISQEVLFWLKEYECVQVEHHKDVGKTIGEYESRGWSLRSYQAAGTGAAMQINHYLLFERG